MAEYTRRTFLSVAGQAAVTAGILGRGSGAVASRLAAPRIRKNVTTLTAASPEIVSLQAAVTAMKALPAANLRSWVNQASIHGTIAGGFGRCQHANWYFLPWHRAYLYYFEEICRVLSGNNDFALPYWDWTGVEAPPMPNPGRSLSPLLFGAGNPLDNPRRTGVPESGRRRTSTSVVGDSDYSQFLARSRISTILQIDDFETFGGGAGMLGQPVFQGELESGCHNFMHRWVGGDMATGGSPYDAVFWMHHANIDRLFSEWIARHPGGLPNDPAWLNADLNQQLVDGQGNAAPSTTVAKVLNTTDLGYVYDTRTDPIAANPAAPRPTPLSFASAAAESANRSIAFAASPDAAARRAISDISEGRARTSTLRLTLTGIKMPPNQDVALKVFVNCKKLAAETPIDDPSYVGSCTFFGHGGHGHDDGVSFALDASLAFARLYGDRPFGPEEPIKVSVVATPLFADQEPTWQGTVQELSPTQVRFDLIKGAA